MDRFQHTPALSAANGVPAQSALLARRRKSLPSRAHAARKSPSTVDPASPEVISSLISSLSTISVPVQSHFDNVPRIDPDIPSAPSFLQTEFCIPDPPPSSSSNGPGFGVTYGAQKSPGEPPDSPYLHPDDAADAPVVRMARAPPSPKVKTTFDPPASPIRPTSKGSYTSTRKAYEGATFGIISAEPPPPPISTAPSIASSSSEGRRSLKDALGLLRKTSRGSIKDKERKADQVRKTTSYSDTMRYNVPRNRASIRSMYSMVDAAEERRPFSVGMEARTTNAVSAPPSRDNQSLQILKDPAPGGIGSGRTIPARESSLRHSFSSSSKYHRSTRHRRYSSVGDKDTKADNGVFEADNNEAEQVTKRIQQLKDQQQKIKSELETDNTPAKATREATETPVEPFAPSQKPSEMHQEATSPAEAIAVVDESAPAPAVLTSKSRTMPSTGTPLSSMADQPQSKSTRQSLDKLDQTDKLHHRQSLEPSTPTKRHKRSPSGPTSPARVSVAVDRPSSVDSVDIAVSDYVSSPKLTQKIPHPTTGRMIAFSEVGDPKGHVVLCCLGMGLTRYLMAFYDELARTLKLRLITLDRPGVGESEPYMDETGTPLGWPGK